MRVAFTGPSGSGKTTMVKLVAQKYGLNWINASSGQIKKPTDNDYLEAIGLTTGKGHLEVIKSGHAHPEAAIKNQQAVFKGRLDALLRNDNYVTDRSFIDNWVYFITQCGMYTSEVESQAFRQACMTNMAHLTHVIFIPTDIPIEDNGSRIPNWYWQKMISDVFEANFHQFKAYTRHHQLPTKYLRVTTPQREERWEQVNNFLNG